VTALALVGAGLGGAVFLLIWRLATPRPSALVELGRFDAHHNRLTTRALDASMSRQQGWQLRTGARLAAALDRHGVGLSRLRQDLALTWYSFEWALGRKVLAGVAGFGLVAGTALGLQLTAGVTLPAGAPVVLALATGVGFSFLTDLEARRSPTPPEFRRARHPPTCGVGMAAPLP
jgi:hypothetical protein